MAALSLRLLPTTLRTTSAATARPKLTQCLSSSTATMSHRAGTSEQQESWVLTRTNNHHPVISGLSTMQGSPFWCSALLASRAHNTPTAGGAALTGASLQAVHFHTSTVDMRREHLKRWRSKWRRMWWPKTTYSHAEGLLEERDFDKVLQFKSLNQFKRKEIMIKLFETLLQKERVVCSYGLARSLARFTHLVIDCAKEGKEPLIYSWLKKKELMPVIFDDLLERFDGPVGGTYCEVHRVRKSRGLDERQRKNFGSDNGVCELIGHNLPPLLPPREILLQAHLAHQEETRARLNKPNDGTPV